jgi:CRP/FNR family transcriptional regulator, cyclic AMP receptor protein
MKADDPLNSGFFDNADAAATPGNGLLADNAIHPLTKLGHLRRFAPQTIFMVEGDIADSIYIILEGRVKVFSSEPDGSEIVLNICSPGEWLGELSLHGDHRSASVMALESVNCSIVTRHSLREAITHDPDLAWQIIGTLISRTRQATGQIKRLALHDVYQRVTHLLQSLSHDQAGVQVVSEKLSQQEIANRIGASRDMVEVDHKLIKLTKPFPARW